MVQLSSPSRLSDPQLDEILALQFTVAWAGEAAGEPARLGWWRTDLIDREGGGDLFTRLAPRTAAWAGLACARAAARRVDEIAREQLARGDALWTPFHFGFEVDGPRFLVERAWSRSAFEGLLRGLAAPSIAVTPSGSTATWRSLTGQS